MRIRNLAAFMAAMSIMLSCTLSVSGTSLGRTVNITVDTGKDRKAISPYIYGVNAELMENDVSCKAVRAGGNRYSAYNWETNASNAGADWKNISDGYFQQNVPEDMKDKPGCADLNDGTVYMDEFVNYLVNTLGDSQNGGIRGYSLDNEPGLWSSTHSLVHPEKTTCAEIVEKSVTMSKAVKDIDPNAEIFGPALFGYGAFTNFADAPDWKEIKNDNPEYKWFIDYYLDEMKKAEDENGRRLLDVLDVHFYTEAKGACGKRYCEHYGNPDCVYNKLNSTRSFWDDTYTEDSWITDAGAEFLPILPALKESIDTYYPGTKLAITEYDFQGAYDVCGAIMEADTLGIFAQNGVYAANLFTMDAQYQLAAINLYTNYDGSGSGFGDTLVSCTTDDIETSTAYAAINGDNEDVITLVVTNKAFDDKTTANIELGNEYKYAHLYGINSMSAQLFDMTDSNPAVTLNGSSLTLEMEPRTVSLLVIAKDKEALDTREAVSSAAEKGEGKSSLPLILGIVGGAAALVAAIVFAVFRIKKNQH